MRTPPLTMKCTIARLSGEVDSFGQPQAAETEYEDVPCYWWTSAGQTLASDATGRTAVDREHLLVARGTDVRIGDRVTQVIDHLGATVFGEPDYRLVEHVLVQRTHIECLLRVGQVLGGR